MKWLEEGPAVHELCTSQEKQTEVDVMISTGGVVFCLLVWFPGLFDSLRAVIAATDNTVKGNRAKDISKSLLETVYSSKHCENSEAYLGWVVFQHLK